MAEHSFSSDHLEEGKSSLSSTTTKSGTQNVNATDLVSSLCSEAGLTSQILVSQSSVFDTSICVSEYSQNRNDGISRQLNKVTETNVSNIRQEQQQKVKQTMKNIQAAENNDFLDQNGKRFIDDPITTTTVTILPTKTNDRKAITSRSIVSKEKKNIVLKTDILRKKETLNIVFCGHVDAGKSTIGGQLMVLTGRIDKRTLEKYQNEAREKGRESWYLAFILDTDEGEREKGKTVEVGRAWFETEKKHITVLDAPGHNCFVPNMIGGVAQADIAILIISARKGEFETGFERGGQTREHAMLVKAAGVRHLIVLINKMDDPTVNWNQARYEEIRDKLTPYLKKCGFKPGENTYFMPCSGMSGALLKERPGDIVLPWYKGSTFIEHLDNLPSFTRNTDGPFRMPIVDRYKDMGVIVMGKIESGCCRIGDRCLIMPNRNLVEVTNIYYEDIETDSCVCGENVQLKLRNIEEDEISPGSILCDTEKEPCNIARVFDAQIVVMEDKLIICSGYSAILHIHTSAVKVQLKKLIASFDRKTGKKSLQNPIFIKQDDMAIARFELSQSVCMESYEHFPQLGRFVLRDEGRTVAVGKVLKIIE